jgi:hypothetical protein
VPCMLMPTHLHLKQARAALAWEIHVQAARSKQEVAHCCTLIVLLRSLVAHEIACTCGRLITPKAARGEEYFDVYLEAWKEWYSKIGQEVYVVLGVGGHNDPMLKGTLNQVSCE